MSPGAGRFHARSTAYNEAGGLREGRTLIIVPAREPSVGCGELANRTDFPPANFPPANSAVRCAYRTLVSCRRGAWPRGAARA